MNQNWKLLFAIFCSFFKISPMTFGGGYAMIPLVEKEVVVKHKWMKHNELTDVLAVSESVPGAIAINSAMMIGYQIAGIGGAIMAMIGIVLPTFVIVMILCILFLHFHHLEVMGAALEGIRSAIVALIAYAGIHIGKTAIKDKTTLVTWGVTVLLLLFFRLNPFVVIICGAIIGILLVKAKKYIDTLLK